jgi:nucleotide-binding universal stress UspA family protein
MRAADLIVAGRPRPDAAFLDEDVFAAALFASGRPVVVAPPSLDVRAPERIVIAWKDCREAARAVHDARPLLTCAARVHVLCVKSPLDDVFLGRAALDRLQGTLGRWGVQGVSSEVVEGGADSAATLALAASEAGADLLVMGGYGRWPVSEMVFGGMTRHVLQHAPWPVFMAR